MIMAGFGVKSGAMTIGDFVLVNSYLIQLFLPLNFLGFVYREIKQSLTDMEDMFKLLDVQQEVADAGNARPLTLTGGQLEFDNVCFDYNPERKILKNVFKVPPGKTVAIVGPSGAGKSTISRLIYRFYDTTQGRILIDGQDIKNLQQDSLRAAIGIVPQDTVLFNDTVFITFPMVGRTPRPRKLKMQRGSPGSMTLWWSFPMATTPVLASGD